MVFAMTRRMSYCTKCGTPLAAGASFCGTCGTKVPEVTDKGVASSPHAAAPAATAAAPGVTNAGAAASLGELPGADPGPQSGRHPVKPPGQRQPHEEPLKGVAAGRPGIRSAASPQATRGGMGRKGGGWWIAPALVVGAVVIAWLVLAGMPFGGREEPATAPVVDTVAEGSAPAESATLIEVPSEGGTTTTAPPYGTQIGDNTATLTLPGSTTTQAPPNPPMTSGSTDSSPSAANPGTANPGANPRTVPVPTPAPVPSPKPSTPARAPQRELSGGQAEAKMRGYAASYYKTSPECVRVRNRGYRNAGYALEVWGTCGERSGSRLLGRWRIDAKNGEIFRQREDGRYLKP